MEIHGRGADKNLNVILLFSMVNFFLGIVRIFKEFSCKGRKRQVRQFNHI